MGILSSVARGWMDVSNIITIRLHGFFSDVLKVSLLVEVFCTE